MKYRLKGKNTKLVSGLVAPASIVLSQRDVNILFPKEIAALCAGIQVASMFR